MYPAYQYMAEQKVLDANSVIEALMEWCKVLKISQLSYVHEPGRKTFHDSPYFISV